MGEIITNYKEKLQYIATKVSRGATIIYPTDTVYGLGACIQNDRWIEKIYNIKTRKFTNPLIALLSDSSQVSKLAIISKTQQQIFDLLTKKFWPGALTIILTKNSKVPDIMVSNGKTVGVRVPNDTCACEIIKACGGILATTSANISGMPAPVNFNEISHEILSKVDIIVNTHDCQTQIPSTIVDITQDKIKIIREGTIKINEIFKTIENI